MTSEKDDNRLYSVHCTYFVYALWLLKIHIFRDLANLLAFQPGILSVLATMPTDVGNNMIFIILEI